MTLEDFDFITARIVAVARTNDDLATIEKALRLAIELQSVRGSLQTRLCSTEPAAPAAVNDDDAPLEIA